MLLKRLFPADQPFDLAASLLLLICDAVQSIPCPQQQFAAGNGWGRHAQFFSFKMIRVQQPEFRSGGKHIGITKFVHAKDLTIVRPR